MGGEKWVHNVGMIEAKEDQYLIHTLPWFSVTLFKMGFSAMLCVIPTAIP